MKNIVIYSSEYCGNCPPCKDWLAAHGIDFTVIDITSGMLPLKQFLKYRDTRDEFAWIRENNKVGIPCMVVNKGEFVSWKTEEMAEYLGIEHDIDIYIAKHKH